MNFEPNKNKIIFSMIISLFVSIFSLYLISSIIGEQIGTDLQFIGELQTIRPSLIFYAVGLFLILLAAWAAVIYIALSLFEGR